MSNVSRRRFLQSSGLAVGAVGALASVPLLPVLGADTTTPLAAGEAAGGPVVAHIRDAARGEVELYVGTRQVTVRDPQLVARLVRATR